MAGLFVQIKVTVPYEQACPNTNDYRVSLIEEKQGVIAFLA